MKVLPAINRPIKRSLRAYMVSGFCGSREDAAEVAAAGDARVGGAPRPGCAAIVRAIESRHRRAARELTAPQAGTLRSVQANAAQTVRGKARRDNFGPCLAACRWVL